MALARGRVRLPAALLVLLLCGMASPLSAAEPGPNMEVFVRAGCPHCEAAKPFLEDLRRERPSLRITVYDVAEDPEASRRLASLAERAGVASIGVPAFLIGEELIVGFRSADTTGRTIREKLDGPQTEPSAPSVPDSVQTSWFGELRVADLGLPLFTIAVGLLDGFNPCAMWVLLFLLSLLVNLRNRIKMAVIAGTFVLVSGVVYFAFMAAWLNVFLFVGFSRAVQVVLGGIALIVGSVNMKEFFAWKRGVSLSIPESAKPDLYARVRAILEAEHLGSALIGVAVLAGLVNVVELLCTAGFPALYTQILALTGMPAWQYYGYLGLYNLAYIFDDAVMVTLAVWTLSRRKLQERAGRWLKLAGGVVMAGLGLVLLLKPDWLML